MFDTIRETDLSSNAEYERSSTITRHITTDSVRAVPHYEPWHDVTSLRDLLPITNVMLNRIDDSVSEATDDGAYVDARSVLGSAASVGQGAAIGAKLTTGESAHVRPNATIKNPVEFPDVSIESGAVIEDSTIEAGMTTGANTTIRGGGSTRTIRGTIHDDVRLEAVVGDNTELGREVVLSTGTTIGKTPTVGRGRTASGRIGDQMVWRE